MKRRITSVIEVAEKYGLSQLVEGRPEEVAVWEKVEAFQMNGCDVEILRDDKFALLSKNGHHKFIKDAQFDALMAEIEKSK